MTPVASKTAHSLQRHIFAERPRNWGNISDTARYFLFPRAPRPPFRLKQRTTERSRLVPPLTSSEINHAWSYATILPYGSMAQCLIKQENNVTFSHKTEKIESRLKADLLHKTLIFVLNLRFKSLCDHTPLKTTGKRNYVLAIRRCQSDM